MRRRLRALATGLVCAASLGLTQCGYRVEGPALPGQAASLHVAAPDTSAVTDPSFASDLEVALIRQLGRRGVALRDGANAPVVLHTRVVSTGPQNVVVEMGRAEADRLAVALVCWLTDRQGRAIWRSPLIEEDRTRPMHGDPGQAEAARVAALRSLATRLASRVVGILLSGSSEDRPRGGDG